MLKWSTHQIVLLSQLSNPSKLRHNFSRIIAWIMIRPTASRVCWSCHQAISKPNGSIFKLQARSYSTDQDVTPSSGRPPPPLPPGLRNDDDPNRVLGSQFERQLVRAGTPPIGSRRRRAAIRQSPGIAFEDLPYQCFQEARKFLIEDREEKRMQIEEERNRIERLKATRPTRPAEENHKQHRLQAMARHLEKLKILADSNDPLVKRTFEDGKGILQ